MLSSATAWGFKKKGHRTTEISPRWHLQPILQQTFSNTGHWNVSKSTLLVHFSINISKTALGLAHGFNYTYTYIITYIYIYIYIHMYVYWRNRLHRFQSPERNVVLLWRIPGNGCRAFQVAPRSRHPPWSLSVSLSSERTMIWYIYIYIYIYLCIDIYMHIHIHIRICICVCMYVCM